METNVNDVQQELEQIQHIKNVRKLKEKINDIKIAMLTSLTADGKAHSRPMYTHEIKDDGVIWFFTQKDCPKTVEIASNANIALTYSDPENNLYVSITGTAKVVQDPKKIDELWNFSLKAWFPGGKDDPNVALLCIEPSSAEYWDSPGTAVVQFISLIKSSLTGTTYRGDNEKINL